MAVSEVERLAALFAGHTKSSGTHGEPVLDPNKSKWNIKSTARTGPWPVTQQLWEQHVAGTRPLGVIPIDENSQCRWGSIDIDIYENLNVLDIINRVEQLKFPLVAVRSKSGGLHLFMFTTEPVAAERMQSVLRSMAVTLDFAGSEIFPKQTSINEAKGDQGNWITMPYGTTCGGKLKLQHGLKPKTAADMTLAEFVAFAEKRRVEPTDLDALVDPPPKRTKPRASNRGDPAPPSEGFADGPPCLEVMAVNGFPDGGRNNALFHIGVFRRKADPDNWQQRLESDNQQFMRPPLPSAEVAQLIKSLDKKSYEYKCRDQPMVSHCDANLCRTRRFGVGDGLKVPKIVSWKKINSDNPVWYITIDGSNHEMEIKDIRDITDYRRFVNQCARQLNRVFRPVSAEVWMETLSEAFTRLVEEQAAEDTTRFGLFLELLTTFLTNRLGGNRKEDLLHSAPWHDEENELYIFQMSVLKRYLEREGMKDASAHDVGVWIKKLGGKRVSDRPTTIKGKPVRLWQLPASAVHATPDVDPPPMPTERI